MVSGIKGTIEELLPNEVYIETNSGLSYLIHISKNTFMKLKEVPENQVIKLRTEYIVSETSVKLFGFIVSSELTMFKMLIKLPKVGPTTALNICGEITLKDLYEERVVLYEKYADITIDEENKNLEETLQSIVDSLELDSEDAE